MTYPGDIPYHAPEIERVVLEKIKLAAAAYVSPAVMDSLRVDIGGLSEMLANDLAHPIQAKLSVPGSVERAEYEDDPVHVPLTWFDHVKKALGFKRYKTRRITRTTVVTLHKLCPHLNVKSDRQHFEFLTMDVLPDGPRLYSVRELRSMNGYGVDAGLATKRRIK